METLEAIRTRRSIRQFRKGIVTREFEDRILQAAMAAPSAGNQQPWEFVVVREQRMLNTLPSVHPYAQMCPSAALVIVVCGVPAREKHRDYWVQDCSAAMENLLLWGPCGSACTPSRRGSRACGTCWVSPWTSCRSRWSLSAGRRRARDRPPVTTSGGSTSSAGDGSPASGSVCPAVPLGRTATTRDVAGAAHPGLEPRR